MYPVLKVKTNFLHIPEANNIVNEIISFNSKSYFYTLIGKSQIEQKAIVTNFQKDLFLHLKNSFLSIRWDTEYKAKNGSRDSVDIFGETSNYSIIIELDKHRADQVAKKFISRSALYIDRKIFYIALCYPGTTRMPINETIKYFGYCSDLSKKLNNEYAGLIIS